MATGNSIRIRWRLKGEKTEKERERKRRRRRNRILAGRGWGEEKKGWRHPLGSREATQEANSPITCRTYRGFAIQASPSNTINIPSRVLLGDPCCRGELDMRRAKRERWTMEGRMPRQGWKRIPPPPPPLPGIRIMQPSFFTRSRNEDTRGADVRKIYLWDEIWRRGEPKQNTEFRNSSGGGQTLRSCSCAPSPSLSSRRNPISQFPLPFPRALFERE